MSRLTAPDAERALLAVIVQNPGEVEELLFDLDRSLFAADENRVLYLAVTGLIAEGAPVDLNLLLQRLEARGELQAAGGRSAVTALWYHDTALLSNATAYVAALRDAAARRRIASTLTELAQLAESSDADVAVLLDAVDQRTRALQNAAFGEVGYVSMGDMLTGAMDLIEHAAKRGDGLLGYDTGYPSVNRLIGGWEDGTFTIIQGTPGSGKTAWWLQSALHVARQAPVAMVQLEMTGAKLGMRALANEGKVDLGRMRRANLSDRDYSRMSDAMGRLAERELYLAPQHVQTIEGIKHWFRRMHREVGAASLWLDNIKIVETDKPMKDIERFQYVTRQLKLLSREMGVPVIAIHHLHRLGPNEKPGLSSGYGSSSIEQDVDNLFSLWVPDPDARYLVDLLVHKTRDDGGAGESVPFEWRGQHQLFVDRDAAAPAVTQEQRDIEAPVAAN